jgi:hypothetical protein
MHQRGAVGVFLAFLLLALLIGGVGLFVQALRWMLIVALVVFIAGALVGARGR